MTPRDLSTLMQQWLVENDCAGVLLTNSDEFLSEYTPPQKQRLRHFCGFTGSVGYAVITQQECVLFVDGRYSVQAKVESAKYVDQILDYFKIDPLDWLTKQPSPSNTLVVDGACFSQSEKSSLLTISKAFSKNIKSLNLADAFSPLKAIEQTSSPAPNSVFSIEGTEYYRSANEKLLAVCDEIKQSGADNVFTFCGQNVCWLLNIRGDAYPYSPEINAAALISAKGEVDLFLAETQLAKTKEILSSYKTPTEINIFSFSSISERIKALPESAIVEVATETTPTLIFEESVAKYRAVRSVDFDALTKLRSRKVSKEIEGIQEAHIYDGAALCQFLYEFEKKYTEPQTEISLADRLEEIRRKNAQLHSLSFPTISSAGPNSAINHYHPQIDLSNRTLEPDDVYLVDSGGQYISGTTDVTRTVVHGTPTEKFKKSYSLVLKAHIALMLQRAPAGTIGFSLDAIARRILWKEGFDFEHGTGHGVGQFLSVHELPYRITKFTGEQKFYPGMVVSNEPGLYFEDEFGIRLENVIYFDPDESWLTPVALTLAPFRTDYLIHDLLDYEEIDWLNSYHARVMKTLTPLLSPEVKDWLKQATAAI